MTIRQEILEESIRLTTGDRNDAYGDCKASMECYAALWETYLNHRYIKGPINGIDVAVMNALQKIGRVAHNPYHADNFVDGAAYLAIAGEVSKRMQG